MNCADRHKTWYEWIEMQSFGNRTWAASIARPYKLDSNYSFHLLPDIPITAESGGYYTATLSGKLVDANEMELVINTNEWSVINCHELPEFIIIGRNAVKTAEELCK
jgi:hypothetical protein